MIHVKTMKQIATSAAIPGVRSLRSTGRSRSGSVGASHQLWLDRGRIADARFRVLAYDAHRQWRNQMWSNRKENTQ